MEPEERTDGAGLIAAIVQDAPHYSFFQAVQLLESLAGRGVRVGHQGPAAEEVLRFRPLASLAFQNADLARVEVIRDDRDRARFRLETTFLGLYGSSSPLPNFYTEELLQETGDESLVRDFLDLFHHRLLSLFYRCWEKYRYYTQFRRAGDDEFSRRILCLAGLAVPSPPEERVVEPVRLLRYLGLFLEKSRPAASLRALVSDYFGGIPVEVAPFVGRWVTVPGELRNRLGDRNCTLGRDVHAGQRVRDRSGKFRITLGPVGLETFLSFLPHEENFRALEDLMRLFVVDQLEHEVELILRHDEIPDLLLTEESPGCRLGQTTWLGKPLEDVRIVFQEPRRGAPGSVGAFNEGRPAAAAA